VFKSNHSFSATARGPKLVQFEAGNHDDGCAECKNNKGFELHHSLVDAFRETEVIVFAGAGISTEGHHVTKHTFFDEICAAVGLPRASTPFPDAMEALASQPNGRIDLVTRIKKRIEYVESFPELYSDAAKFHRELATIFGVDTIVTTNWDSIFERECKAQPFVNDPDMAFWDAVERRVLKIHGSIDNLSTLVATRNDYTANLAKLKESLVGSQLKTLLATKTIVFFGYSFRDDDFREIMTFVRESVGDFKRQNYIVTIDNSDEALHQFRSFGLVPICTDATFFLQRIKAHLFKDAHFIPDEMYDEAKLLLRRVQKEHLRLDRKYNIVDDPEIVYCSCYQDGLMHLLQRVGELRSSGKYSHLCRIDAVLNGYRQWRMEKLKAKKYDDVAYIDGYLNGLQFIALQKIEPGTTPPLFYLFTNPTWEIEDFAEFQKALRIARRRNLFHKLALKTIKKDIAKMDPAKARRMAMHHACNLW